MIITIRYYHRDQWNNTSKSEMKRWGKTHDMIIQFEHNMNTREYAIVYPDNTPEEYMLRANVAIYEQSLKIWGQYR